jgi:peptidoglycan/xylan/chitin deacetylase (PgdA/CDA1 family)
VKRAVDWALRRSPLQWRYEGRQRDTLTVLAYHAAEDAESFAGQLDYLCARRQPLSLEQVHAAVITGERLPAQAVLITFDDADRSLLEVGMPLLVERGIPAAAFVVTGLLDSDRPFWWQEVESLLRHGGYSSTLPIGSASALIRSLKTQPDVRRLTVIDELRRTASRPAEAVPQLRAVDLLTLDAADIAVGSHSVSHPCLDRCDDEKVEAEVGAAQQRLKSILGRSPLAFAYPNGNVDPRVRRAVALHGHRLAFGFDHRISEWPPRDPLLISRVKVSSTSTIDRFATSLSGLHPAVHRVRTSLRRTVAGG